MLDIDQDDPSEDKKVLLLLEQASSWIDEFLGVQGGLGFASRTEYYNGSGTQKLILRHRPVFTTPTIQVFVDKTGYYGAPSGSFDSGTTNQVYGTDFVLQIDQADGTSRSGILVRLNDYWPKPSVRQVGYLTPFIGDSFGNVKVVYSAGYTIDTLPALIRQACNFLVARLMMVLPLGLELNSEGYEERSIGIVVSERQKLMATVSQMLNPYRNWRW